MVCLFNGCETNTATSEDERSNTVPACRGTEWIPHELRIHVGMRVNEAWRDKPVRSVNRLVSLFRDITNGCDTFTTDSDIGFETGFARTINDCSVANHKIMHCFSLCSANTRSPSTQLSTPTIRAKPYTALAYRHPSSLKHLSDRAVCLC